MLDFFRRYAKARILKMHAIKAILPTAPNLNFTLPCFLDEVQCIFKKIGEYVFHQRWTAAVLKINKIRFQTHQSSVGWGWVDIIRQNRFNRSFDG